jgi:hypothetical protein
VPARGDQGFELPTLCLGGSRGFADDGSAYSAVFGGIVAWRPVSSDPSDGGTWNRGKLSLIDVIFADNSPDDTASS